MKISSTNDKFNLLIELNFIHSQKLISYYDKNNFFFLHLMLKTLSKSVINNLQAFIFLVIK